MPWFRPKPPADIAAVQWTGANADEVWQFVRDQFGTMSFSISGDRRGPDCLVLLTKDMPPIFRNDWIIRKPREDGYFDWVVMDQYVFAARYEEAKSCE